MAQQLTRKRTYLVRYAPAQIEGARSEVIEDVYIPATVARPSLRLRLRADQFELTRKTAVDGDFSQQQEDTIALSGDEHKALRALSSKLVKKRRFYCTVYGHNAEVDVYLGDLDGLMTIRFPFASDSEMRGFTPPEVCLVEVSNESFMAGGALAGRSFADVQFDLERLQYVPQFLDKEY